MAEQQLMQAIGRLERAVSRLEQVRLPDGKAHDSDMLGRHRALKDAAEAAVAEIDRLLTRRDSANG